MSTPRPPRLLDRVRDACRVRHFSLRTERTYVHWVRRFILYHGKRHPREMGGPEVEAFLSHLAVDRRVAASTQNQALWALLFLYREVLGMELPWLDGVVRANKHPNAEREFAWRFLLPARQPRIDPRSGGRGVVSPLDTR